MSDAGQEQEAEIAPVSSELPDDLPPVEPPSAGFMLQLFVVPALIVLVIVGVWGLFGKLASGQQDWEQLLLELGSSNPHRHRRAAVGLAQMLKADLERGDEGEGLVENRRIAVALSELLDKQLQTPTQKEEELRQQAFLARTLGFIDMPDVVLPTLLKGIDARQDRDIRRNSMASIALIAGRMDERGTPLDGPDLVTDVIDASQDEDEGLRQLAAYTLGLLDSREAAERLTVLLENADPKTRVNAAVALARNDSTAGFPVFRDWLEQASEPFGDEQLDGLVGEDRAELIEQRTRLEPLILKNAFTAITDLSDQLTADEKQQLVELLEPLTRTHHNAMIRMEARKLILAL